MYYPVEDGLQIIAPGSLARNVLPKGVILACQDTGFQRAQEYH